MFFYSSWQKQPVRTACGSRRAFLIRTRPVMQQTGPPLPQAVLTDLLRGHAAPSRFLLQSQTAVPLIKGEGKVAQDFKPHIRI